MKALTTALRKLASSPQGQLPQSTLTRAQQQALRDFARHNACIRAEPAGRGIQYRITDHQSLDSHLRHLSPGYQQDQPEDLPRRADNIGLSRNSKGARHRHEHYHLLLKSNTGTEVHWTRHDTSLDLGQATRDFGAAALSLQVDDDWHSEQPLWLVENQALFDRLDWLPAEQPVSFAWYRGQLSNLLLNWLGHQPRAPQVILFPDYDGVGLMNFIRLRDRLGDQCSFWLMPQWREKLTTYGNNQIWRETFSDFQQALPRLDAQTDSELMALAEAMQRHALALEQEAVWLKVS